TPSAPAPWAGQAVNASRCSTSAKTWSAPRPSTIPFCMSEAYHRGELAVALDPSHPSHILPPPLEARQLVLDVGCGAGQTLIAAYPDRVSFGLDIDRAALKLGRSLTDRVHFVCARAEALPWPDNSFDLVTARVSLAYTDIGRSLQEIRRVLKSGGR